MKRPLTYATAALLAISGTTALAQEKDGKDTKAADAKSEGKEKKADIEITIKADTLAYDTAEITVTEGETVKINLESISALPKAAGGHNLVVLAKGTDVAAFATKAMTEAANEYIPQDKASKEKILAHTKLLGPTEKDSITFTAPAAGTYDYICTFPGHFAVMKGKMKVTAKGGGGGDEKKEEAK